MTKASPTPSGATPLPPPPRRRGTAALFAFAFASGTLFGAGVTAVAIQRTVRRAVRQPDFRVEKATRFLTRKLDLDHGQRERVREVLTAQVADMGKLRHEVWPRVLERLDRTEREIGEALSARQRERWEKMASGLKRRWLETHPTP